MKLLTKIFISFIALSLFSTANAVTYKMASFVCR